MTRNKSFRWIADTLLAILALVVVFTEVGTRTTAPISSKVQDNLARVAPTIPDPYRIEVTGSKQRWEVRYPDAAGRLAAGKEVVNVRSIHVPLHANVVLILKSKDYIYTVAIPQYHLKEIAVPDLEYRLEFRPSSAGNLELIGEQLCGDPHSPMPRHLVVEPPDRFLAWLKSRS